MNLELSSIKLCRMIVSLPMRFLRNLLLHAKVRGNAINSGQIIPPKGILQGRHLSTFLEARGVIWESTWTLRLSIDFIRYSLSYSISTIILSIGLRDQSYYLLTVYPCLLLRTADCVKFEQFMAFEQKRQGVAEKWGLSVAQGHKDVVNLFVLEFVSNLEAALGLVVFTVSQVDCFNKPSFLSFFLFLQQNSAGNVGSADVKWVGGAIEMQV